MLPTLAVLAKQFCGTGRGMRLRTLAGIALGVGILVLVLELQLGHGWESHREGAVLGTVRSSSVVL
jgi:hypothetical protein